MPVLEINDMRRKIKEPQHYMHLLFQPQYEVKNDKFKLIGAETLLRWKNNSMPIESVIDIARDSGKIKLLGEMILEESLKNWEVAQTRMGNLKLSINVCPSQLYDKNFAYDTSLIIDMYDVDPENITLEITEGYLIENYWRVKKHIRELQDKKVSFAIDDYSTKYSSPFRLAMLDEVQTVKIDKSYVEGIETDDNKRRKLENLINQCHELGKIIITEGIENKEQSKIISQFGCKYHQGFFYNKPLDMISFILEGYKK